VGEGHSYLTHDGKVYGIPTVINADSMIVVTDKVGSVDSYGVIFDPKLKGKTAMEDAWINSVTFTAIYLKNSENAKIAEPGNLTADELGLVMEFLIKHKRTASSAHSGTVGNRVSSSWPTTRSG
jgi:putative spermidine/putrescine transport system substrate-binding protein